VGEDRIEDVRVPRREPLVGHVRGGFSGQHESTISVAGTSFDRPRG
jgi:hypothetical protein